MKQISIITLVFILLHGKTFCQVENEDLNSLMKTIPKEKVVVTTNAGIILAGETLYYKFYNLYKNNDKLSSISKIGYVDLVGENNIKIFKHKLELKKGVASGDFFIPPTIKTGNYKLIAYTKWMNNNTKPFFEKDICIVNPYRSSYKLLDDKTEYDNFVTLDVKKEDDILKSENGLKLNVIPQPYKSRSKVSLVIDNLLGEMYHGNYSLSIRKCDELEIYKDENFNSNEPLLNSEKKYYLPEIRGEIISGRVTSLNTDTNVSEKIVTLSMPSKDYVYKNVKTNSTGNFYFNLFEDYIGNDVIMQIIDSEHQDYEIIVDSTFNYQNQLKFNKLTFNETIKDWVLRRSIQNQIESAYYYSKKDSVINKTPSNMFYGLPSVKYVLDDYKRFKTIKETFVEVIEEAALRTNNDQYEFVVYNYEEARNNSFKNLKPLVLFDGIFIQNNEDIVDYDVDEIETISVVRGIYFYGPSIFNGIIDIKTKNGDFNLYENEYIKHFDYDTPLSTKIYYSHNYDNNNHKLDKIPDYRNQLLWIPTLSIDSNQKMIDFYASDVEGVFEIVLEGYTLNGKYIQVNTYIEINN